MGSPSGWEHVDAGDGLVDLQAAARGELGIHPAEYFVRRDLSLIGIGVTMLLPGGAGLFLYEPRHPTAIEASS